MKKLSDTPNCIDQKIMQRINQLHISNELQTQPDALIRAASDYCVKEGISEIPSSFDWMGFFQACGVVPIL